HPRQRPAYLTKERSEGSFNVARSADVHALPDGIAQPKTERDNTIMKSTTTIIAITLFGFLPVTFVHAQTSPKAAAGEKQAATAGAGKRTDVYHVHFTKAALGKAVQLGDWLKTPDPNNPMPDHFIVLRHQDGDAWDYVVITHLGPKATVEAAGTAVPPDKRDLSEW